MLNILRAFLTAAMCGTAGFALADNAKPVGFVVEGDFGGVIGDYVEQAGIMRGSKVIINGACMSACTLFLTNSFHLDVCMTMNALFGFHQSYQMDNGKPVVGPAAAARALDIWVEYFYGDMPGDLQKMLYGQYIPSVSNGDAPNMFFTLPAEALVGALPVCESGWQQKYKLYTKPTA